MPERPGMPAWLTWAMLLAIAAVEVPIYWIAFQPFHGKGSKGSDVLSGTLAISTAVLMVLLPHLAGRTVRSRAATGSIKAAVLPALALMGVWGFSSWALGDLRARLVLQHPDAVDGSQSARGFNGAESLDVQRTLADNLHLTQETVTWMFVALLFLSGGIGFLLGLLREHPYVDAYRAALERRANRFRQREEARVMRRPGPLTHPDGTGTFGPAPGGRGRPGPGHGQSVRGGGPCLSGGGDGAIE